MSVLDLIQAEEEKGRHQKAEVQEKNRLLYSQAQENARAEASALIAEARKKAAKLLEDTQKRLSEQRLEILKSAASRDHADADAARAHLPQAAVRIVERIEQK